MKKILTKSVKRNNVAKVMVIIGLCPEELNLYKGLSIGSFSLNIFLKSFNSSEFLNPI